MSSVNSSYRTCAGVAPQRRSVRGPCTTSLPRSGTRGAVHARRPVCQTFLLQLPVGVVDDIRDPLHPAGVSVQPAPEQPFDRRLSGVELHEMEPPAQGEVHQGDRAVGGVHGADDVEGLGQGEGGLRVLEAHLLVAILQQEIQLAEDLGEVPPVDLVDDEEVPGVRLPPGHFRHVEQGPVPQLEAGTVSEQCRPVALDEVLVGVRRVELDQPHPPGRSGQAGRYLPGSVGLAGSGRALEDDLALVVEQLLDVLKKTDVKQEFLCQFFQGLRRLLLANGGLLCGRGCLHRLAPFCPPPHDALSVETAGGPGQAQFASSVDELIEKVERILVPLSRILGLGWGMACLAVGLPVERSHPERCIFRAQRHQKDRDRSQRARSISPDVFWCLVEEGADTLAGGRVVFRPQRSQGLQGVFRTGLDPLQDCVSPALRQSFVEPFRHQ